MKNIKRSMMEFWLTRMWQILEIQYKILNKAFLSQQNFTNVIGIVKEGYLYPMDSGNPSGVNLALGEPGVILIDETQLKTLAHEVGHTLGFCEEYDDSIWEKQNKSLKETGGCANGDLDGDGYLDLAICFPFGCPTQTFSGLYSSYGNISDGIWDVRLINNRSNTRTANTDRTTTI